MLIMVPLMIFVYFPLIALVPSPFEVGFWAQSNVLGFAVSAVAGLCVYIAMFLLSPIYFRLSQLLVDRHFVETLCVTQSLYLLAALHRDDALARGDRRRDLVRRFDDLSRLTRLLGVRYSARDPALRLRVQRHFREIACHVAERRLWVVTPMETTLEDLRRDMRELTHIFITSTYGELKWVQDTPANSSGGWMSIVRPVQHTIGLLAPFAGIAYLLLNPELMRMLDGTGSVIMLLLVAWAVLALDNALQLGLVSSVTGLAKSIKELR